MTTQTTTITATGRYGDYEITLELPGNGDAVQSIKSGNPSPSMVMTELGIVVNNLNFTGHISPVLDQDVDNGDDEPREDVWVLTGCDIFEDEDWGFEVLQQHGPHVLCATYASPEVLLKNLAEWLAAHWDPKWMDAWEQFYEERHEDDDDEDEQPVEDDDGYGGNGYDHFPTGPAHC